MPKRMGPEPGFAAHRRLALKMMAIECTDITSARPYADDIDEILD